MASTLNACCLAVFSLLYAPGPYRQQDGYKVTFCRLLKIEPLAATGGRILTDCTSDEAKTKKHGNSHSGYGS
jgi:hypothetical protein